MITLFAVGVVTGTVLSFEMGLLWPRFVGTFGPVFGLGFAIERFSVFLEIRARLFISPRTVEYHLHKVFGMWQSPPSRTLVDTVGHLRDTYVSSILVALPVCRLG